jgi:MSHA biogenesis protein MshL
MIALALSLSVPGCGPTRPPEESKGHIDDDLIEKESSIPAPVSQTTLLPVPRKRAKLETYTVVVSDVPVKDLLFSMARDAKLNLDIHNDIKGSVTLNAIDQTLPQILDRISKQADIRYEVEANSLRIRADKPFVRIYKIDYVNITRISKSSVSVATTLGSTGAGEISEGGSSAGNQGSNSSITEVKNTSNNLFWDSITKNIISLLAEEEKATESKDSEGSNADENKSADSSSTAEDKEGEDDRVIVNKEAGIIAVRATHKQHRIVEEFVDVILGSAKRQVLIEATIAEIKLSDHYQSGVDWSLVASDPSSGIGLATDLRGAALGQSPFSSFTLADAIGGDQLSITLKALEQFGDVKVLSSPKIMALNNQPAILKVIDNFVYFEIDIDTTVGDGLKVTTIDTDIKTVPVGFVMSVTPFINEHDAVTLNIRPTISRIIDKVEDPNPEFKNAGVVSEVPVIQVREIESILQINSGDTAIIGGLMQDSKNDISKGIPFLSDIPYIGALFSYEEDVREKSELIIFIKPIVIKHASLMGDMSEYQKFLPAGENKK